MGDYFYFILCSSSSHRVSVLAQSLTLPEWLSARVPLDSGMRLRQRALLEILSSFHSVQPLFEFVVLTSVKWAIECLPLCIKPDT